MVLTEKDYDDFLFNLNREYRSILPVIYKALVTSSFLFIGYHIKDINFRIISQGIMRTGSPYNNDLRAIMQHLSPELGRVGENTANSPALYLQTYLQSVYKIRIYWGSLSEFCDELRNRWEKFSSSKMGIF
jgi:hypothetical protein